ASDAKFSMCVKAAVLAKWCADHGFDLSGISWSIVGFILAPLAKRDTESAGETWVVDVASESVDSLLDCLRQFEEKPVGRDKVKAMLAAADIRNGDGAPVWVAPNNAAASQQTSQQGGEGLETD